MSCIWARNVSTGCRTSTSLKLLSEGICDDIGRSVRSRCDALDCITGRIYIYGRDLKFYFHVRRCFCWCASCCGDTSHEGVTHWCIHTYFVDLRITLTNLPVTTRTIILRWIQSASDAVYDEGPHHSIDGSHKFTFEKYALVLLSRETREITTRNRLRRYDSALF